MFGVNIDEWIGVTLPKTVFIQNYRLGLVDIFLKLGVVGYVIISYIGNDDVVDVQFTPQSQIAVWGENGNFTNASKADWSKTMCDPDLNDRYDYWYDTAAYWTFSNFTCIELGPDERLMKKPSPQTIFAPTYVNEDYAWITLADNLTRGACDNDRCAKLGGCFHDATQQYQSHEVNAFGQCLCRCVRHRTMYTTGTEALRVHFTHLLQWPTGILEKLIALGEHQPKSLKEINMITIVRHSDDSEYKRFAPGDDVVLTIEELLILGGGTSLEDHSSTFTRKNALLDLKNLSESYKNQLKLYPYARTTGTNVRVSVSYHNPRSSGHKTPDIKPDPVCYIDITATPGWVGDPHMDLLSATPAGEQMYRHRYYNGIIVSFHVSGKYAFISIMKFLQYLASAIVYMCVPNFLMTWFTKYCLGTLSDMYYRAQCQLLDSWELFSGQVCRALVGMFAYHKLLEGQKKRSHDAQDALSWNTLKTKLTKLFQEQKGLDPHEIDGLLRVLLNILDKRNDKSIHQQQFVDACVNADICSLRNWANLFDQDRRPWILERVFDTNAAHRKRATMTDIDGGAGQTSENLSEAAVAVQDNDVGRQKSPGWEGGWSAPEHRRSFEDDLANLKVDIVEAKQNGVRNLLTDEKAIQTVYRDSACQTKWDVVL